ncbi:hypothetical protein LC612_43060 [Nostoc sp. CHAB 5834]|nr:hypothetical protein [Nostoc sp. CHAB 5834]
METIKEIGKALTQEELVNISGGEIPMSHNQANSYGKSVSASFSSICDFCSDFYNGFRSGFNAAHR